MNPVLRCLCLQIRILTLTANRNELLSIDSNVLVWGLVMVWLAGIGRYWDAPLEPFFMRSGLPSLIYIFVLGAFLWMFIFLLRPANWSYMRLVTYISMTAVPAFLYAIPFERMYGVDKGAEYNAIALVVVATWRVLMLGNYLVRVSNLNVFCVLVAVLLPLMTIVSVLMGLHKTVDAIATMGGIRDRRHVVQLDEKDAVAHFTKQTEYKAFDVIVDGQPIQFEERRLHTYRGRTHVVYVQDGSSPLPPGFKEVALTDPEYNPMDPTLAVAYPVEKICEQGVVPVFWGFVVAVIYGWFIRKDEEPVIKKTEEAIETVDEADAKIQPTEDVNNQP
jgi:hypothetical protein